jgi:hypothetical protein
MYKLGQGKIIRERSATGKIIIMPIYAGTVTIRKRDNTMIRVVENVIVTGEAYDDMKRNYKNLTRAIKYSDLSKQEDPNRWVIIDIILHHKLGLL